MAQWPKQTCLRKSPDASLHADKPAAQGSLPVALQIRLVSEQKLTKLQEKKYRSVQARILSCWEQYVCHQKLAAELLRACSLGNGPIIQNLITQLLNACSHVNGPIIQN